VGAKTGVAEMCEAAKRAVFCARELQRAGAERVDECTAGAGYEWRNVDLGRGDW